jgi:hypothetical protein
MLEALFALLKIIGAALGLVRAQHDQSIGAELQRGHDAEEELKRVESGLAAKPDSVLSDPNNRDNSSGVQSMEASDIQPKK